MGDDESEFYIRETVKYQTALEILKYFLTNNTVPENIVWIEG